MSSQLVDRSLGVRARWFSASWIFLFLMLLGSGTAAAQQAGTELIAPLLSPLWSAIDRAELASKGRASSLRQLRDELFKLEQHINSGRVGVTQDLSLALSGYRDDIVSLASEPPPPDADKLATIMAADAKLKNDFVPASAGIFAFSRSLQIEVRVEVVARGDGLPVAGYIVQCNPRRRPTGNASLFPFPAPTNDAVRYLPPGIYVVEILKDKKMVAFEEFEFGGSGKSKETKKLIVD